MKTLNSMLMILSFIIVLLLATLALAECPTDCTKVLISTPNKPAIEEPRMTEVIIPQEVKDDKSVLVNATIEDENGENYGRVKCEVHDATVECSF